VTLMVVTLYRPIPPLCHILSRICVNTSINRLVQGGIRKGNSLSRVFVRGEIYILLCTQTWENAQLLQAHKVSGNTKSTNSHYSAKT